jgi:hypothetical protein
MRSAAVKGSMMISNGDQTNQRINELAEKMKKLQKLSAKRTNGAGSITLHQKRQIMQTATQVGKLLKQIETLSPGFMGAFKDKLPNNVK